MLYTTFNFLVFAAVLLLTYYLIPRRMRWVVLLAASVVFYFMLSRLLILHIAVVSVIVWGITSKMARLFLLESKALAEAGDISSENKKSIRQSYNKNRKTLLILGCFILFASLLFFKFYNPAAALFSTESLTFAKIAIPVGISFYTLRICSYLFDVYNKKITAEKNLFRFFLFAIFFPDILQGPISRYDSLSKELRCEKEFDYERFVCGFIKVLWGFFKKMVIADRLYVLTHSFFENNSEYQGIAVVFFAIIYTIQLYADFSGGIDISIGLSAMLGIDLAENFNLPFFSKNISEFWRRWHITLGTWLKDYVFFPLSFSNPMSRFGKALRKVSLQASRYLPAVLCMLVLWFCSAVWHGEGIKFLLWGGFHWLMVTLDVFFERGIETGIKKMNVVFKKIFAFVQILGTFLLVAFGELIFGSSGLQPALYSINSIFKSWDWSFLRLESLDTLGLDRADLLVGAIAIGLLFILELLMYLRAVTNPAKTIYKLPLPVRWLILLLLIGMIVTFGYYGYGYDPVPFEYFKF